MVAQSRNKVKTVMDRQQKKYLYGQMRKVFIRNENMDSYEGKLDFNCYNIYSVRITPQARSLLAGAGFQS